MQATHTKSFLINGEQVDWFNVDGEIVGLHGSKGIIGKDGFEIEFVPAEIATAIFSAKARSTITRTGIAFYCTN